MKLLLLHTAMVLVVAGQNVTDPPAPSSSVTPSLAPSTSPTSSPTLVPTIAPTITGGFQDLDPVCGDCWCIADSECPAEQVGITQSFPKFISETYASFVATNSIPLQAEGGGQCNPFLDILAGTEEATKVVYAEASAPQCEGPTEDTGYCAFVFEDGNSGFGDGSECQARRYAMENFAIEGDVPSNAAITHKGPCGVCSSAADLAVRMQARTSLPNDSFLCGLQYYTSGVDEDPWQVLVGCFENLGFSSSCAELWGHFTATNANLCALPCIDPGKLNGDPPECALNECLSCSEPHVSPEFDRIGGRSQAKSGITAEVARSCSDFYPVIHDPCPGQTSPPSVSPAPTTDLKSDASIEQRHGTTAVAIALVSLLFWRLV
mmetsp:Transcript_8929/g.14878  ORF Transcript_8929/g.14878 Transcript_8929/m.14878 type:complete len:377 (+) Transcript_8929:47-1177(+)